MNPNDLNTFDDFKTFYLDQVLQDQEIHLKKMVQAIFEHHPDLEIICAQGYTPYFNDGDRCEHSQELALVGKTGISGYLTESFTKNEESPWYVDISKLPQEQTKWGSMTKKIDTFNTALQILQASRIFEHTYDTDFLVKITYNRDTQNVFIQHEFWNPEY